MAVRSDTSRRAVLQATIELLGDEPPGPVSLQKLSIEGIARRAGVSKMTIYRWWPSKAALVIDSFVDNHVARTVIDENRRALDALREHMRALKKVYEGPEGRLIAQLIGECQYERETLAEFKERFWFGRTEAVERLIQRAMDEGDLNTEMEPSLVADLLYGPIYMQLLFDIPVPANFTDQTLQAFLHGIGSAPADGVAKVQISDGLGHERLRRVTNLG